MGKSRSKSKLKLHSHRLSPFASLMAEASDVNTDLYNEIMTKMMSHKPMDKQIGASMITNGIGGSLADGHEFGTFTRTQMEQLIRTLGPFVCDRVENVRSAAIDALCELSSYSDSICELMITHDVMTPLSELLQKFTQFECFKNDEKSKPLVNVYVNSCQILSNLCDVSTKAVKIFTDSQLCNILINSLRSFRELIDAAIASAQCLCVVTESNVLPQLMNDEIITFLKNLLSIYTETPAHMHLALLSAFILINLNIAIPSEVMIQIFTVIDACLCEPCMSHVQTLSDMIIEVLEDEKKQNQMTEKHKELKHLISAKRLAMELLTNMTASEDVCDIENLMDLDDDGDSDDESEQNLECDTMEETNNDISPEIVSSIIERSLFSKILDHLSDINDKLQDSLNQHYLGRDALKGICLIHQRCLSCVHNIIMGISSDKLPIDDAFWQRICQCVNRPLLIEESTGVLRAVLMRNNELQINNEQFSNLYDVFRSTDVTTSVKMNIIKILSLLAERSNDTEFIENITIILIENAKNENDLIIKAEIFDAIIDVFSEDGKTDSVIKKMNLIVKLKDMEKGFKREVKRDRLLFRNNPIISTVKLNLSRFIKYKEKNI